MNDKMRPALIGGVVVGVLSAIPFVNIVNACCCAWAIVGGLVATYMYVKDSQTPASTGDGAMLGLKAGVIGALIYLVLGIPLNYALGNTMAGMVTNMMERMDPSQADVIRQQMAASQSLAAVIMNALIAAVLLVLFATVGGLLGVPLFEKRKNGAGAPPPPPPPNFGGPGGGGSYGANT